MKSYNELNNVLVFTLKRHSVAKRKKSFKKMAENVCRRFRNQKLLTSVKLINILCIVYGELSLLRPEV